MTTKATAQMAALDPARFPHITSLVTTLRQHTERDQYEQGLDLILAGIDAVAQAHGARR
ncbi:MAG: TetR/AcrR family transcriptional regulator C-terminal domain-containing protein [Tetrasphaera sp.]